VAQELEEAALLEGEHTPILLADGRHQEGAAVHQQGRVLSGHRVQVHRALA
jgi:hypothetical protein